MCATKVSGPQHQIRIKKPPSIPLGADACAWLARNFKQKINFHFKKLLDGCFALVGGRDLSSQDCMVCLQHHMEHIRPPRDTQKNQRHSGEEHAQPKVTCGNAIWNKLPVSAEIREAMCKGYADKEAKECHLMQVAHGSSECGRVNCGSLGQNATKAWVSHLHWGEDSREDKCLTWDGVKEQVAVMQQR